MRFIWIFALILLFCVAGTLGAAENARDTNKDVDITVVAEGSGAVFGGDIAHARDDAIADAKKNAVEQGVGVFVSSKTLGQDYMVVEKTILTKSDGYIADWSIVENSQQIIDFEGSQLLILKIKARVKMIDLISDLSDIEEVYNTMKRPKVMVLMNETNAGEKPEGLPSSTTAIMARLQDMKFDIVDSEVTRQLIEEQAARAALETGDIKAAAVLAMKKGAQILILGTAVAKPLDIYDILGPGISSASALINARIVYADTGEVLYATPKSIQGKGLSISDAEVAGIRALEDAGSRLLSVDSNRFTGQLLARWARESQQGRVYRIVAHAVRDSEFEAIKSAISNFRGFTGFVGDSSFEGKTGQIDFRYTLTVDSLRNNLRKVKVKEKVLEIIRTSGTVTECTLELP